MVSGITLLRSDSKSKGPQRGSGGNSGATEGACHHTKHENSTLLSMNSRFGTLPVKLFTISHDLVLSQVERPGFVQSRFSQLRNLNIYIVC